MDDYKIFFVIQCISHHQVESKDWFNKKVQLSSAFIGTRIDIHTKNRDDDDVEKNTDIKVNT